MAIINPPSVDTFPTARVGNFDALAADSNRRVKAKADFSRPADTQVGPFRDTTSPQPIPDRLRLTPQGEAISHVSTQVGPDPFGPTNPVTGLVDPKFNLAAFDPTGRATPGVDINAPQPRATGTSNVQGVVAPAPVAAAAPATVFGPERTDLLGKAAPSAAPTPAPRERMTLEALLQRTGIGTTGAGALASLGLGSKLVAQQNKEIDLAIGDESRATESLRAGQELESQIASRGAAADVSAATAEKIGAENLQNQARLSLGLPLLSGGATPSNYKFSVQPGMPGEPPVYFRGDKRTGGSQISSTGSFESVISQNRDQTNINSKVLQTQMADALRLEDPNFANATDAAVLQEVQRRITASQGG